MDSTPVGESRILDLGHLADGQRLGGRLSVYCRGGKAHAPGDWSTGFFYEDYAGHRYSVIRLNGGHQNPHRNHIEDEMFVGLPHVHRMTERYQRATSSEDHFAMVDDSFPTLDAALDRLADLAHLAPAVGTMFL